jgi:uncharacterized protein YndB with AHSA1/START domain
MDQIPDRIERVIILKAPRERVWRAISQPAEITKWFGEAEGDFRQGSEVVFFWDERRHHIPGKVVAVQPPSYFAYLWDMSPGDKDAWSDDLDASLVEFRLEPVPEGTELTLVESGFSKLPAARRAKAFEENTGGWQEELGHLQAYLEGA